jgi:CRP-like cAMP-binding protein
VYVLLGGFVRVVNQTAAGDQTMIAIRTAGDLIGELAALDRAPRLSTAIAASTVTGRVIDGVRFREFAEQNPVVGDAIAQSVRAKFRTATRYRVAAGQASVLTRVARVLAQLVDSYGRRLSTGVLIDIPLPMHDVASLVGAAEKSVSRAYHELREAGVIKAGYRAVLIRDLKLLHRYADGDVQPTAPRTTR